VSQLANLRIGRRLGLGFGLLLLLMVLTLGLAVRQMSVLNTHLERIAGIDRVQTALIAQIRDGIAMRAVGARNMALLFDATAQAKENDRIKQAQAVINDGFARLDESIKGDAGATPEAQAMLATAHELETQYEDIAGRVVAHVLGRRPAEAMATLTNECMPMLIRITDHFAAFGSYNAEQVGGRVAEANAAYRRALAMTAALGAAALVIGGLLGWLLTRSITRPVGEAVRIAEAVAEGDLTTHIETDRRDELGQLLNALKRMNDSLVKVVGEVRSGSEGVATGSSQIATGGADLSQRTERQASNLQETAASMEQLSSTVRQSGDAARQANQLASSAAEVAARGGSVVSQVVATMDEINTSSKKMADIIGVIDGIAFQTNILALNAAVEAARAGEQGRGFAVVAGEVRSLAQRSAAAAREIKDLIGASVDKVEGGARLVADAGKTMTEIVGSVQRVTDIIGEITAASGEQTDGIGQVSAAVVQLDQMTQQNAALVEQSAAAAISLKDQAARLADVVRTFKLAA
jgi:methyl-accepting chemotaxis protein